MLAVLTRDQLAHAIFPLGDSTKDQVRAEAAARGLAVADKPDSHDICFIADGDTQGFLAGRLGERPGDIVDADGAVLGSHAGAFGFTVGQRRGLNLSRPAPSGQPRYVLSIQPGPTPWWSGTRRPSSRSTWCAAHRPVWIADRPAGGRFECLVQLRAHGMVSAARIEVARTATAIVAPLHEPQRGVAAGQALVMYDGDRVLGSATITGTDRVAVPLVTGSRAFPGRPARRPVSARCPAPIRPRRSRLVLGEVPGPALPARTAGPRLRGRPDRPGRRAAGRPAGGVAAARLDAGQPPRPRSRPGPRPPATRPGRR